jgi:pimeloyl-ACP methyl ester carboxylesterase
VTAGGIEPIIGWAADVPFTALPPSAGRKAPVPLIVTWHMMDPPRSDEGFAALLPLAGVPAWRIHLGMPFVGRRPVEGAFEAAQADPLLRYVDPLVQQATAEFPEVLDELRARFGIAPGPIALVGASLGGNVVLNVLATAPQPVSAVVLVNPAIRAAMAVDVVAAGAGGPYPWTAETRAIADRLDFVSHAGAIAARDPQPALLVISGALDFPASRGDATALVDALRERYAAPERVQLTTIDGLGHSLLEAGPTVDAIATSWLTTHS